MLISPYPSSFPKQQKRFATGRHQGNRLDAHQTKRFATAAELAQPARQAILHGPSRSPAAAAAVQA
jgi:hypothetical protein